MARIKVAKSFKGEVSRTKQSDAQGTDIVQIMAQYQQTGILPAFKEGEAKYGDYSNVDDYRTAASKVAAATQEFNLLPVRIRSRFSYDVGELLTFLADPNNLVEAVDLGLIQSRDQARVETPEETIPPSSSTETVSPEE